MLKQQNRDYKIYKKKDDKFSIIDTNNPQDIKSKVMKYIYNDNKYTINKECKSDDNNTYIAIINDKNGDTYYGEMKNNKKSGVGVLFINNDKDYIIGNFKDNEKKYLFEKKHYETEKGEKTDIFIKYDNNNDKKEIEYKQVEDASGDKIISITTYNNSDPLYRIEQKQSKDNHIDYIKECCFDKANKILYSKIYHFGLDNTEEKITYKKYETEIPKKQYNEQTKYHIKQLWAHFKERYNNTYNEYKNKIDNDAFSQLANFITEKHKTKQLKFGKIEGINVESFKKYTKANTMKKKENSYYDDYDISSICNCCSSVNNDHNMEMTIQIDNNYKI